MPAGRQTFGSRQQDDRPAKSPGIATVLRSIFKRRLDPRENKRRLRRMQYDLLPWHLLLIAELIIR